MTFIFVVDGLELIPVEWPRLAKLFTIEPVRNKIGIPEQFSSSVCFQKSFDIAELFVWIAFLLEVTA